MKQQAACRAAGKQSERLHRVVHAHRRTLQVGRRDFGNHRRQARLQHIKTDKVNNQISGNQAYRVHTGQQTELRRRDADDAQDKNLFELVACFTDDDQRNHHHQARNGRGQIDFPMLDFFQTEPGHRERQRGKQCHLRGVQGENAEIERQQPAVF